MLALETTGLDANKDAVAATGWRRKICRSAHAAPELAKAVASVEGNMIKRDRVRNQHTAKRLNIEQKELRNLRAKAGLSQPEMAVRLNVKLSTLQSYEYGRTKRVPPEIIAAARRVVGDANYYAARSLYRDKSISQIATAWMKRLRIQHGSFSDLAAVLSVDRSTVSRWFDENPQSRQEPSIGQIAEYERAINAAEFMLVRGTGSGQRTSR